MAYGRRPSCKAICKYATLALSLIILGCSVTVVVLAILVALDKGWNIQIPQTRQLHVLVEDGDRTLKDFASYNYKLRCVLSGSVVAGYYCLAGFIGFYGSWKSRYKLVVCFCMMFGLAILCELGFAAYVGIMLWKDHTPQLIPKIPGIFRGAVMSYHINPNSEAAVNWVQKELRCCGTEYYSDWDNNIDYNCHSTVNTKCSVPDSCCILPLDSDDDAMPPQRCAFAIRMDIRKYSIPHTIYQQGCAGPLQDWLRKFQPHAIVPVWSILVLAALQTLGVIVGAVFAYIMRLPLEHYLRGSTGHKPVARLRH